MTPLEELYNEEVQRLNKIIDLQKKVIQHQDYMLTAKDNIINMFREQKEILTKSLVDISQKLSH